MKIRIEESGERRYLKLDASNDPITGDLLIKPGTDSLTALEVQDKDGNQYLSVDTINNRVGINKTPASTLHIKDTGTSLATLGTERIATAADRTFASDTGHWVKGATWSIGSGVATHTAGANNMVLPAAYITGGVVAGTTYKISFTINTTSIGSFTPYIGNNYTTYIGDILGTATYAVVITAADTTDLTFVPDATWAGTLDNVSVMIVTPGSAVANFEASNGTTSPIGLRTSGDTKQSLFLGYQSGQYSTGQYNVGLGYWSLQNVVNANGNFGLGSYSLNFTVTGNQNTGIGVYSMPYNATGGNNTAIGYSALNLLESGDNNVGIGMQSGGNNGIGSGNIYIGYQAGLNDSGSNHLYIQNSSSATPLIYGLFSGTGAGLTIHSQATDGVPLIIKGKAAQSSNLTEWQNSSGTALVVIEATGSTSWGIPTGEDLGLTVSHTDAGNQSIFNFNTGGLRKFECYTTPSGSGALAIRNYLGATQILLETQGTTVINEGGLADNNFRVEGVGCPNLLSVDATAKSVTIGSTAAGALIIGVGTAGVDYQIKVDGETNDGTLDWMEDEDYFRFNDDLLINSAENIYFRDTAIGIYSQADSYLNIFADGGIRIGDSTPTNYTQFDSTGHQTMVGTAKPWNDIRIEPIARTTGTNAPTFRQWFDDSGIGDTGTTRGVYLYEFDDAVVANEKETYFTLQMDHSWDSGDIHIHVHWIAESTAASSKVRWGLEYTWIEPGGTFGATNTIYADTVEGGATGTTAGKHEITEFAALTPGATQDGLSTILIGRLFRNSSNAADTYTGDAGLLYIDAHYQLARLGSTDEYTA